MDISKIARFPHVAITRKSQSRFSTIAVTLISVAAMMAISESKAQTATGIPFTENFSADNLKGVATTADWDTTAGVLKLPVAGVVSPIQSLTGTLTPTSVSASVDPSDEVKTRAVAVGDLDGDGDLDLAFGNDGLNSVYFNNGAGGFVRGAAIPDDYFTGGNSRSAALADFNGDGHLDVVFAEFGSGQENRIHFNNGSGSTDIFTAGSFVDLGDSSLRGDSVATGDVDNDGDIDVVLGVLSGFVKLFRNDGFGNFGAAEDITDGGVSRFDMNIRAVLLGDLDRDGDLDLVAARDFGDTRIYRNDGTGDFHDPLLPPQSAGSSSADFQNNLKSSDTVALGDVNGDGYLDLIVGNDGSNVPSPGKPNRIYLNAQTPANIFPLVSFEFADMAFTNAARLADVDRDGDLDLITADSVSPASPPGIPAIVPGPNRLYINDPVANAPNLFPDSGTSITADSLASMSLQTGDFDGDGDLDLVVANQQDDPDNPTTSGANQTVLNEGILSGVPADQLYATAQSVKVNGVNSLTSGFILIATDTNPEANRVFTYWLSDDGGSTWILAHPEHSVDFDSPVGNDLRWRVDLNSPSPLLRPDLDTLEIIANRAPQISSTEVIVGTQDVLYSYAITTTDPNSGDIRDIRDAATLPAWLTLTDNGDGTATLEGTPTNDNVGTTGNTVDIEVVDSGGKSDTQTFTIDVANVNDAPTVVAPIGDILLNEGDVVNVDASLAFDDIDGDALTYSATGLPASVTIDPMTGIVSGTLTAADITAGPDYAVSITADDGNMGTVSLNFMLTVNDVADDPSIDSTPVTAANENQAYAYNIDASDPDAGDTLTITAPVLPAWLAFMDNGDGTASLTGTPAAGDVGTASVTLRVTDATGGFSEQSFDITVQGVVQPPQPPAPRSSGGCTVGPTDGTIDPTLPILMLISLLYMYRRRLSETRICAS